MDKAIAWIGNLNLDGNRRKVILMLMITEVPHSVEQRFADFSGRFLLVALAGHFPTLPTFGLRFQPILHLGSTGSASFDPFIVCSPSDFRRKH
jgi:hypothetical protein